LQLSEVSPFAFAADKADEIAIWAKGFVPTEVFRAELSETIGDDAALMTLAAGAPYGCSDLVRAGLAALGPMTHGSVLINDASMQIFGEVLGPDQAVMVQETLAALPAGSHTLDLTLLDDGTPTDFELVYAA
jgi:hypothetical protein